MNQVNQALSIITDYEKQFESIQSIFLKMIIITTKLYILIIELRSQECFALFSDWKEQFNTDSFTSTLERKWYARYLHTCGIIYYTFNNQQLSEKYYEQALFIRKELHLQKEIAISYMNLAIVNKAQVQFKEAVAYYEQAYTIAKNLQDLQVQGLSLLNLGSMSFELGDLNKSIDSLKESIRCLENISSKFVIEAYGQYTHILIWMGRYDDAHSLISKMDQLDPQSFHTLFRKSVYYNELGKLNLAEDCMRQCIAIVNDFPKSYALMYYSFFSKILLDLGKEDEAKEILKQLLNSLKVENINASLKLDRYFELQQSFFLIGDVDSANETLLNIEELDIDEYNEYGQYLKIFSKALYNKNSKRLHTKLASIDLFEDLYKRQFTVLNLDVQAGVHLIDLLLYEYQLVEDLDVLSEINQVIGELVDKVTKRKSPVLIAEMFLLRSKISIISGANNGALEFLDKAIAVSKEKNLSFMVSTALKEKERLQKDIANKANSMIGSYHVEENVNLKEMKNYMAEILKLTRSMR